jgi:pantoate--beta-alanine ligase
VERMVHQGETDARKLEATVRKILSSSPDIRVDYVSICDPDTLDEVSVIENRFLCAIAGWLGKTRLIDNRVIQTGPEQFPENRPFGHDVR